ncbi:MAG: hypothetical protein DI629_10090 [Mesorhizobium amorphae]|nr:MAG: hypothetical protein DI629_10090 [Mesorhizobium amorphae]
MAVERRLAGRDAAERQRTWREVDGELRALDGADLAPRAFARHRARAGFQLAAQPDRTAIAIVNAHDPAIIVDAQRKEVVTASDVRAMLASNAFVARIASVAPPASPLTPAGIAGLRARYAGDPAVRLTLTEAQVRNAVRARYWPRLPVKTRNQVVAEIRRTVRTPGDVATAAREVDGAFANVYIKDLQRRRRAAIARTVFPNGPLGGLVAMKRATMNLDALNMAWPHM